MHLDREIFLMEAQANPFAVPEVQAPQREQIDPVYLGALLELGKVEGLSRLLDACKFTAKVFDKSLVEVIIDACRECATDGYAFGCNK